MACLGAALPALAENEPEQRWRERQGAGAAYDAAAAKTATARNGLAAIDRDLRAAAARLADDNETYLETTRRYYAVREELEAKYGERLEAEAVPELLSAQRRELRRQYDILVEYRNYVDDAFFKEVEDDLRDRIQKIADTREAGRLRIANEIDPEIARLRAQKSELVRELNRLSTVNHDTGLTTRWFNAAQDLYEAEKSQLAAAQAVEDSNSAFIKTLAEASPPFLQSVRVIADGKTYYDFSWIREGYEDDVTASIEYARQRDQLAESLSSYIRSLNTIKLERGELHLSRWRLAEQMHALSSDLTLAAEDYRDAQFNKVLALAITEIAITVAEVAVTGGVATALRRGEELTQRAVQAATRKADPLPSIVEDYAAGHVRVRLRTTLDAAAQRQFDEMAELIDQRRMSFMAKEIEKEVLPILLQRGEAIYPTLAEAAANVPRRTLDPIVKQVSRNVEYRANQLFPKPDIADFMPADKFGEQLARAVEVIGLDDPVEIGAMVGKAPDVYASYSADRGSDPLSPDAEPTSAADQFGGEAVEWAIGTGVDGAGELIRNGWSSGAAATQGAQVSQRGAFGRQAAMGAVFSVVEASAKTVISAYYEGEINEAHARFWGIYAQLTAMHQYYYEMLKADEELAPMERDYRNGIMKARAFLAEIGLPRRAGGDMPQAQPVSPDATIFTVELDFSTPLTVPPAVRLDRDASSVEGEGRHWRATFEVSPILRKFGEAHLSVTAGQGNQTYADLDTEAMTVAYIPADQEEWAGYERGTDVVHILRFATSSTPEPECIAIIGGTAGPPLCVVSKNVVYDPGDGDIAHGIWKLAHMDGTPARAGMEMPVHARLSWADGSPVGRGEITYGGSTTEAGGLLVFHWGVSPEYRVVAKPSDAQGSGATLTIEPR